jgi:hypothetical protein
MTEPDLQREKEEISRQQYWYTTTVLAFVALIGNVIKPANLTEFCVAAAMVLPSMGLGIYMVIICHREYLLRDKKRMGWWKALGHSFTEHKGALFCNALITFESVRLLFFLGSRAGVFGCHSVH